MSLNSSMNTNVVKTALDDVFMPAFKREAKPGYTNINDGAVFIQSSTDRAAQIEEIMKGVSLWSEKPEEENVETDDPRFDNKITFTVKTFAKGIDIPKEFFDDNMHGSYEKVVRDLGNKGYVTMDDDAFSIYRGAFTTTLTADGVALVSDSHTTIGGQTVDNKLTATLSVSAMDDAITAMAEQKDQAGVILGNTADTLLVPPALFREAVEITESTLLANTTDNNVNWISAKYNITVKQSERLGAAAGGSNTAWFLLSDNHSVTRWSREGMSTSLRDWRESRNDAYFYRGRFRQVVGALDYVGVIGSDGSV